MAHLETVIQRELECPYFEVSILLLIITSSRVEFRTSKFDPTNEDFNSAVLFNYRIFVKHFLFLHGVLEPRSMSAPSAVVQLAALEAVDRFKRLAWPLLIAGISDPHQITDLTCRITYMGWLFWSICSLISFLSSLTYRSLLLLFLQICAVVEPLIDGLKIIKINDPANETAYCITEL